MKNADEGSETIEGTANRSIAGLDKVLRVLSQAARLIRDKGEAVYDPKTGQTSGASMRADVQQRDLATSTVG